MAEKYSHEAVWEAFPSLHQVKDRELADKIADVWVAIWKESDWEAITDVPKNAKKDNDLKLVPHINAVTETALAMADAIEKFHGHKADRDFIIAGGLLHDVDKMLMYSPTLGAVKTRFASLLPHGLYTVHKMLERGMSHEMGNMVACHSDNFSTMGPVTFEGMILKQADHGESEATRMARAVGA